MAIADVERGAEDEPLLVSASTVARMLNISTRSLWRLRSAGVLPPPVRLGGTVRWRIDEIKNWIAAGCPPEKSHENERRRA
jgi:predicted DNA-binding transcriptional regulator AlpA